MTARLGDRAPFRTLDWALWEQRFLFFTGKGGVGKTTVAATVSVALADAGRRVLVVGTDPASNLTDVFGTEVGPTARPIPTVPSLQVMNLDPDAAAASYRNRVLDPLRGTVPDDELYGIEEQLAGECTVEVAAFDQFTQLIADPVLAERFDHVIFDTAPTGHTLRLLRLPSAWAQYIEMSPEGASCLGPRSGLEAQREQYEAAVAQLADGHRTALVLVSRPDPAALREAARAGHELAALRIANQRLVVNGLLSDPLAGDPVAEAFAARQAEALAGLPESLRGVPAAGVPLVPVSLTGVLALRALAAGATETSRVAAKSVAPQLPDLDALIEELASEGHGAVLVMGKGGVGKTTLAIAIAKGLAEHGHDVHLSTTDPAGRLDTDVATDGPRLTVSRIDPAAEVARYTAERLNDAADLEPERLALLEEDLRSPCTEELAVFRAFGSLLGQARRRFVVLDTAPSGHTLRLLDLTGSYHRQILHSTTGIAGKVTTPLMRLQDPGYSRILIVTLPELTPVNEAAAIQDDLRAAGIEPFGWIVNASLTGSGSRDPVLQARAALEEPQLERVRDSLSTRAWLIPWQSPPDQAQRAAAESCSW